MAKQNFLAGGFYGKLGATVGQRWKNKRTIRTYVVPENPRTPKQVANRNKFSASVPFAQKGMSMNYRSPAFASETTTEWALRMSSAKYAMDIGLSDVAAIPVVPRGFTSAYTITEITLESVIDTTHATLSLVGTLPAGSKRYSLMLYFSEGARAGEYMLCEGVSDANDNTLLTVTCENTATLLSATVYGVIVSKDDIDAQTVTYSAKLEIKKESRPAFTLHIDNVTKTATTQGKLHITVETSFLGGNLVGTFTASDARLSGDRKTKEAVFTAGNEDDAATESFTDNAATISDFTINKETGVIEFDITPSNVQTTQSYEGVFVSFNINWENAYTDETTMSSSFASSSSGWAGGYLQPELDMQLATTPPYVTLSEQIDDEYTSGSIEFWLTDATAIAAWNAKQHAIATLKLVSGNSNINLVVDGVARTGVFNWSEIEQDWGADGDFNWLMNEMTVAGVTSGIATSGTTNAFVVRMCLSDNLDARLGTYDASHRWTPTPDWSIPANTPIGLI